METIIIGHRGVAGHYPENTRSSIQAAIDMGLKWIEVDIQPTKDNTLVVCHDHTVNRCSNGTGRLDEMSLSELKELDFGSWFSHEFANEKLLTLDELLQLAAENSLKLNLEVKVDKHDAAEVAKLVIDTLQNGPVKSEHLLLSSFNHTVIKALYNQSQDYRLGVLSDFLTRKDRELLNEVNAYSCNLNINWIRRRQIERLRQEGYKVMCYTVNNPNKLKHLPSLDGIFSDYPERFI
ncbi:glycerophosphoryl diester phosphodiesterase [Vibrio azureus]|uniref:Glycerophosphoryl diester phosphodiesterase n=1 Tax=Vibrio azureus NBRC 104587 TaxID=1219077 RepID=U3CIS0_9VIBR|nr:glycerophosphodiester phosphodiesterase family protein [Vibrio azureus]AUI88650.1 glycerophosphoryl diester phosphodiesterase [Vibrio azureus]GAD78138.1 glycerophosphoryl diester phosphodiesterase [Vibrio azureus NBRC 104587]